MKGGVSRSHSRLKLSKLSRGKQLDAVGCKGVGMSACLPACLSVCLLTAPVFRKVERHANSSGIELPPSHRDWPLVGGDLAQGTIAPLQSKKRQLDAASTSDSLPVKRAWLTPQRTETGLLRRSSRLRLRQNSTDGEGPSTAPSAPCGPRIEADAARVLLPSNRAGLLRANVQQSGLEQEEIEEAAKRIQQNKPPNCLYTSVLEPKFDCPVQVVPAKRLRQRQISSEPSDDSDGSEGSDNDDVDDDVNEHQLKRARLTRKNLAIFDEIATKKATNKTLTSISLESETELSTKTTSTTTSGFAIRARKNGILNPLISEAPGNLEDIRRRYAQSRETASPTESVYEGYVNIVGGACNKSTMAFEVGKQLLKDYPTEGYQKAFNQAFTAFPKNMGFNNGLSVPQPDYIEGLRMEEYDPFPIDEYIDGAVLFKDDPFSLTLPHLAGEWKGRGKDMEEACMQSAYNGAALVYARNQALSFLGKSDPPGHAEIITFTTDGTNLNLFAHYATPSEEGISRYHHYLVKSTNLRESPQGLKDGRRGLRNEQEQARKQSYALRDQLKERWKQRRINLHPIA